MTTFNMHDREPDTDRGGAVTIEASHDRGAPARQSACEALAAAERAGASQAELERLADHVILSRIPTEAPEPA
jgi:hypothetical protein